MTETIGQQLKQARLSHNLTIPDVVKEIHVREHYLEALEADRFDLFSSPAQMRGFLGNYAAFLGLRLTDMYGIQLHGGEVGPTPTSPISHGSAVPGEDPESAKTNEPTSTAVVEKKARTKQGKTSGRRIKTEPAISESGTTDISEGKKLESTVSPESLPLAIPEDLDAHHKFPDSGAVVDLTNSGGSSITAEDLPAGNTGEDSERAGSSSDIVFISIGSELRSRRELLGLNLQEIEQHIHVRKHYLEAIENGHFNRLPSSVQARGMINNYARFLDLDCDALLLKFADALQLQYAERHQPVPAKQQNTKFPFPFLKYINRLVTKELLAVCGFIIIFIAIIGWGATRIFSISNETTQQPTAPSISDVLLLTPSPTMGATPDELTTNTTPSSGINGMATVPTSLTEVIGPVHVLMVAMERAYVIVIVDGEVKYDGRVVPDTAYPFDGENRIEVTTGNGAAIKILFNGKDMGLMGARGQVVSFIYTIDSIFTPTSTVTPTFTPTPIPSSTPTPSRTPRVSPTIVP